MKAFRPFAILLILFIPFFRSSLLATSADPANFTESVFIQNAGMANPTGLAWAPDGSGRLFVTRKTGEVQIVQYNASTSTGSLVATPFATISPVYTNSECGLIGLCFDPDFINNHYVYFFVSVSATEQQIVRYTDSASIGSNKTILVSGLPTIGQNHDGGGIGIGPDGKLYWSIGDNGTGIGVDNDLTKLASKVGRANRFTGAACNDNPFFDGVGPNNDYIWARGFRNPFTLTFQPGTGNLWVNVVGSTASGDTLPHSGPGYEQSFLVTRGSHAGWNDYENNQPAGYLTPMIAYPTNGTTSVNLTAAGASRSGGVVTFTTTGLHPFRQGAKVTVSGVAIGSFNGTFTVTSRTSDTQFTVNQSGPNETSGGGTVATQALGGCITGGCFYDSTAYPIAYRGNFFFGDLNTGLIQRVPLDANNVPVSIDPFVTGYSPQVDIVTGPDGALYFTQHDGAGRIRRMATTNTAQNIIIQPTQISISEGGSSAFTVRLASAPATNVNVSIAKSGGDADLNIAASASLTFTPANWNQLQTVTIAGAEDADFTNGTATFQVSAPTLTTQIVTATEIDNDDPRLVISTGNITCTEGGTASFTVSLASAPPADVTVNIARSSGDTDVTVTSNATLIFTAGNFATPQTVNVAAAEDADNLSDSAIISITLGSEPVRTVNVNVTDNDNGAPAFTSTPVTSGTLNATYSYDVNATGNPTPIYSLVTAPSGMAMNNTTGLINWIPSATGTFAVTVRASNGVGTPPTQSFNIVVSADAAPTAGLTQPLPGAVLSGTNAEFFGDGFDDVGCVKAEFFVDGVLRYTDINSIGHYHYGGAHALFDTTPFTNGPHTLRIRVTDSIGQTAFQEVNVSIGNGMSVWRTQNFTSAELSNSSISGDLADPDHDGICNLLEYSLNLAPKQANLTGLPAVQKQNISGNDYITLTFVRVKWATDLVYQVEASDDFNTWTMIDPLSPSNQTGVQNNIPSQGLQTITVKDVTPATGTKRFMRLKVVRP